MEASTVLPLGPMYTDLDRGHPGTPDAEVCWTDQCDVQYTIYVIARPIVGLLIGYMEVPIWCTDF